MITYHIDGSWFLNVVGRDEVRFFEFSCDKLTRALTLNHICDLKEESVNKKQEIG